MKSIFDVWQDIKFLCLIGLILVCTYLIEILEKWGLSPYFTQEKGMMEYDRKVIPPNNKQMSATDWLLKYHPDIVEDIVKFDRKNRKK